MDTEVNKHERVLIIGSTSNINQFIEAAANYRDKNALVEFSYDEWAIGVNRLDKIKYYDTILVINPKQSISTAMAEAIELASELGKNIKYFEPVLEDPLPIITICGSLKFKDKIAELAERLTMEGNIVLTPLLNINGSITSAAHGISEEHMYEIIHRVHNWKIEICDKVLIANFESYIGEDTLRELNYAKSLNKEIDYVCPIAKPTTGVE